MQRAAGVLAVSGYLLAIVMMVVALRDGVKEADPTGSVISAILAAFGGLMTYLDKRLSKIAEITAVTAEDMEVIRADVLSVREAEAADRGLQHVDGKLLPVPVPAQGPQRTKAGSTVSAPTSAGVDGPAAAVNPFAPTDDQPDLLWDHQQFAAVWARFVMGRHQRRDDGTTSKPVRLAVHGEGGVGKTTLALLLTLGLLRWNTTGQSGVCTDKTTPVPLLMSLSGYDGRSDFVRWVNRKARRVYPSLDRIQVGPNDNHGPVGRLLNEGRVLLVLDGWDEMLWAAKARAAADLYRFFRGNWHLIVFSRATTKVEVTNQLGRLSDQMDIMAMTPPTVAQRQAYLRHRATTGRGRDNLHHTDSIKKLSDDINVSTALQEVLATPMMVDLAARAVGGGETTVKGLEEMAARGPKATRAWLLRLHVAWATSSTRRSPQQLLSNEKSKMWLTYLARVMIDAQSHQLSWWRTIGQPPWRALAVVAAVSVLPAYWLALQMPVGLTRGLAIGCGVGVGAAFLRSRPMGWLTAVPVFATIAGSVLLVGTIMRDWEQAIADSLEIASSVTAAYLVLDTLLKSHWPRRISSRLVVSRAQADPRPAWIVRAVDQATGAGQWVTIALVPLTRRVPARHAQLVRACKSRLSTMLRRLLPPVVATLVLGIVGAFPPALFRTLSGYVDKERSAFMMYIGVTFGIGLAVIAARSYITNDETIPKEVRFSRKKRTEPWYYSVLVAVLFATSIGAGGAIGGWMRYTSSYAVAVGIVFLFVAGFPVGIVGGSVRWLCRPLQQSIGTAPIVYSSTKLDFEQTTADDALTRSNSSVPDPDQDEKLDRPETTVTMRADRRLAILIFGGILTLSAISIWILNWSMPEIRSAIRTDSPSQYSVGPEDSILIALTLGTIVAATYTVWPVFVIAHLWQVARRRLPWRLRLFAIELKQSQIIVRDGDTYRFKYSGLRSYLGRELYEELRISNRADEKRSGEAPHDQEQ